MSLYDRLKTLAEELRLDVLSLYIYLPEENALLLVESYGLFESAVGSRIPVTKGLVGRAFRTGLPVSVKNPQNDPDFYYLPGSGEERLHSFLALPVKNGQNKVTAIVVAQTISPKVFHIPEIEAIYSCITPLVEEYLRRRFQGSAL
jgi:phosphotransferase system enzyme I (PtsP)